MSEKYCVACEQRGHHSHQCKTPLIGFRRLGEDGQVKCADCKHRGVWSDYKRTGCRSYVPDIEHLPQTCISFEER